MTSIRVSLTILCALSLAFALSVNAQTTCPSMCGTNDNTVLGFAALGGNTTGINNTATGVAALGGNTTGANNTATGVAALTSNTAGVQNTATGAGALNSNTGGSDNTAIGNAALSNSTTGSANIAIGFNAGVNVTTGSNNIHIGSVGFDNDSALIFIGRQGLQTSTFIAGIFGAQVLGRAQAVEVNQLGQLGTTISSRRVKDDIRDMDEASGGLVKLRPVTFRYKAEPATGPRPIEYGLIAEEVAEIYPELVVRDKDGQPSGVRYHVLPAMLLNEVQKQHAQFREQTARLDAQQREIDELRAQVRALIGGKAAARE